jgi:hypothetical protein
MSAIASNTPRSLNATQMMLLKLFSREMSEQETKEIRDLLLNYLDAKLQNQVEKDMKTKKITQKSLDAVLKNSQRTKVK